MARSTYPIQHGGGFETNGPEASYTDVAGAYFDLDAGGTFAQFGAKGPGSIGAKIRTVLAGVALTVLTFTAAGAATFGYDVSMSSGKTFAAQALTATTIQGTGDFIVTNAASNTYVQVNNSGANVPHFYITRQGGTVSSWDAYLPSGSTDLRFSSVSVSDAVLFTAAGGATFKGNLLCNAIIVFGNGATTSQTYLHGANTSGDTYLGTESATGGSIFTGSTAYASVLGSGVAKPLEFGTNGVTRLSISSAGAFDFKSNAVSGITTLTTNNAEVDTALFFSGQTNSFPRMTRSGTTIQVEQGAGGDWASIALANLILKNAAVTGSGLTLGGTQQTTIGANGAASALTANPLGYLVAYVNSTKVAIPYYNA